MTKEEQLLFAINSMMSMLNAVVEPMQKLVDTINKETANPSKEQKGAKKS